MSADLRRVGLVVEGETERKFFEQQKQWFQQKGIALAVVAANGKPRLVQEADRHLSVLRLRGCERVFFLIDQDDGECAPAVAKTLQAVRRETDVVVCVLTRTLEAWVLADTVAIHKATGGQPGPVPTDVLSNPDQKLRDLFFRKFHRHLSKMEMIQRASRHLSLDRCAQANASARRFVSKLNQPSP